MLLSTAITALLAGAGPGQAQSPGPVANGPINYDLPNYAYSPLPTVNADGSVTGGLRKFVDSLAGLSANNLGQYIPIAQAMGTATPAGVPRDGDYYEIAVVDYTEKMHSDLPGVTHLRGYVQIEPPGGPQPTGSDHVPLTYPNGSPITFSGQPVFAYKQPHYLGPLILATKNKPTRVKFYNLIATGAAGKLLLPVDPTIMGAGKFDIDWDPNDPNHPLLPGGQHLTGTFPQNRATLHLHGGNTPWVSDGTPHQWVVPQGETSAGAYTKGVSTRDVPDMPAALPNGGAMTFFWSNEQSGRLMFYHDHVHGLTRLNVYAGEAAGYLLVDPIEEDALAAQGYPGTIGAAPDLGHIIPLIIQDKTYVWSNPSASTTTPSGNAADGTWNVDPLWFDAGCVPTSQPGDFWFPHIYMVNQNPLDLTGANSLGRWDYGPWFWPPTPSLVPMPVHSVIPESFMDTPVINGTVYPYAEVQPAKYRLRILNACNDRFVNLQFYQAEPVTIQVTKGGAGYTSAPTVTVTPAAAEVFVASIKVDIGGSGYTTPVVAIENIGTTAATAEAVVDPSGTITAINITAAGAGFATVPTVTITDAGGTPTAAATATAVLGPVVTAVATITGDAVTGIKVTSLSKTLVAVPTITIAGGGGSGAAAYAAVNTEIPMVPAVLNPAIKFPAIWKTQTPGMTPDILDQRQSGVPDPEHRGPAMIQIATEGGLLPSPVVINNVPVGFEQNKRNIVVLNVAEKSLFLGPAERADVVVDFSPYAGKTIILYNDSPAPVPAGDPRNDFYTGDLDYSITAGDWNQGGAPTTLAGYGPNIRTIMQFRVAGNDANPNTPAVQDYVDAALLGNLQTALPAIYKGATAPNQPAPIIPQPTYPAGSGGNASIATYAHIQNTSLTFTPVVPLIIGGTVRPAGTATTVQMQPKCIQELFDLSGRMNSLLGTELPFTTAFIQTTLPYGYVDPTTETIPAGETQIWKITHNGVDTHAIHFHLVNVQIINRVGWDGAIRVPDENELGWKETVRMNPLEDIVVAATAIPQTLPFPLPVSKRPLDVTATQSTFTAGGAVTGPFTAVDPVTGNPLNVTNVVTDFGWEYVWHCHLLGHEENDMMRPLVMPVANTYRYVDNAYVPSVTITPMGTPFNGWYKSAAVNIAGTSLPLGAPVASITYWTSANTTPITVAGSSATVTLGGSGTVYAYATDSAVNQHQSAQASLVIQVDTVPPVLTGAAVAANAAGWNNANVSGIILTAADAQSGLGGTFTYKVTQGNRTTTPVSVAVSGPTYTTPAINLPSAVTARQVVYVTYTLSDLAGNAIVNGTLPVSIKIDKASPTVASAVLPAPVGGWIKAASATVTLTGTDNAGGSGIALLTYSINGGAAQTVAAATTQLPVTAQGVTTIVVSATDVAGNKSANSTVTVRMDNVAPAVTLGAVTGNYSGAGTSRRLVSVRVPVTVVETGSGINTTVITVTSTGGAANGYGTATFNGGTSGTVANRTVTLSTPGVQNTTSTYTVTVVVTDIATNRTTTTVTTGAL